MKYHMVKLMMELDWLATKKLVHENDIHFVMHARNSSQELNQL